MAEWLPPCKANAKQMRSCACVWLSMAICAQCVWSDGASVSRLRARTNKIRESKKTHAKRNEQATRNHAEEEG